MREMDHFESIFQCSAAIFEPFFQSPFERIIRHKLESVRQIECHVAHVCLSLRIVHHLWLTPQQNYGNQLMYHSYCDFTQSLYDIWTIQFQYHFGGEDVPEEGLSHEVSRIILC